MASQSKKYGKAPIREAVIDVRISPRPGLTFADLRPLHDQEKARYPTLQEGVQIISEVSLDDSKETTRKTKIGYMLRSADGKKVVQAQVGGFTFSWLAPYDTWQSFRSEAMRLWREYAALTSPVAVSRTAVRYINRLDLPLPVDDLRRYINVGPDGPAFLFDETQGFLLQLRSRQREVDANLILTVARIDPPRPDVVSVVLDIDLFDDTSDQGIEKVEERIEHLHGHVETCFEKLITDDTRTLIA